MTQSTARRRRRHCKRKGHSRLKVIEGRLYCTTCETYLDEVKDST